MREHLTEFVAAASWTAFCISLYVFWVGTP